MGKIETYWIHDKPGNLLGIIVGTSIHQHHFGAEKIAEIFAGKLAMGETATQNARQGIVICSNLS